MVECGCSKCLYTPTAPQKLVLTLSFSASESFDATAIVIGVISSAPLALGDRRESIEPSRCQDFVWETMVSQVLNRTPGLARLVPLICLPV